MLLEVGHLVTSRVTVTLDVEVRNHIDAYDASVRPILAPNALRTWVVVRVLSLASSPEIELLDTPRADWN